MHRLLHFDEFDQSVTVEAGMVTEVVQRFAETKGLYFPVDFASRGSSQIGGNVATNAGGIKVLRYGLIRNWVQGLEVVTGQGDILRLNQGLIKNATGYDLRHLFIGSEGTLGFITQVTLGLTRPTQQPAVFVFGVADLAAVMKIYHSFKRSLPLLAFEMFTDLALKYVLQCHPSLTAPLGDRHPYYVLLEIENTGESTLNQALELFGEGMDEGWITDGVQSQSVVQSRNLWRLREDISEATSPFKPYKNDISVRIADVPNFLSEVDHLLKTEYPQFEVVWFGHIGDGNLHINILKPETLSSEEFLTSCKRVDQMLFKVIEKYHGSISAEHGVGLTKKPYLLHTRSAEEIALMKQIKRAFDPDNILNPGKIFDL